jgi:hypothetical protein
MSYSRWSDSAWYTYWSASGGSEKETQLLTVHYSIDGSHDWTYALLNEKSPQELKDFLQSSFADASADEISELIGYVDEFIKDIENDFKTPLSANEDTV